MERVEMVFWDVEHGHSTYIRSPNGKHIVVDLGTCSYGSNFEFSPLTHLKYRYGVERLDYVIITHPHVDHIDDIFNLKYFDPRAICYPGHLDEELILEKAEGRAEIDKLEEYFRIVSYYNPPTSYVKSKVFGGLLIKSFLPSDCSQNNLNNHSIVTIFDYAGIKVLIPGDNESASWNELSQMREFLDTTEDIDVLLAPHHGRKSGFHSGLIEHFNPGLTIVSDGGCTGTSVTSKYSSKSRGKYVKRRGGEKKERYCVTTRKDGVVVIKFGWSNSTGNFLKIVTN